MSAVILLLLIISPLLNKRYSAKWRYFVWLVVALRLIIPFKLELPQAPVNIPVPNHTVVFRQEGAPIAIIDESYIPQGNTSSSSADYAPIITLQELLAIFVSSQEKPADFRHKPYNFFTDFLLWSGDAPVDSCYQSYL